MSFYGASGQNLQGSPATGAKPFKEKIPSGYRVASLAQFDPQQMQLYNQQFSHVGPNSYLSRLASGDQDIFNQIEAPAMRQFQEFQGQNASRFSGSGMGARRGSGFQNSQSQAASDFAMQLQANRQALQRQALMDLRGFSSELLGQRPYLRNLYEKDTSSGLPGLIGAGIGAIGGGIIGGPAGALQGASLGGSVGNAFGGRGGGMSGGGDLSALARGLPSSWSGNSTAGLQGWQGINNTPSLTQGFM